MLHHAPWTPTTACARGVWQAFMGSDAALNAGHGAALLEEPRVFMGGMSDESGASAPLAMAIKQLGLPVAREVAMLEEFVFGTLWAGKEASRSGFLQVLMLSF